MERVADVIPNKYLEIGLQLGLTVAQIQAIRPLQQRLEDYHRAYDEVFGVWKKCGSPPYTWRTLIRVLKTASVGEVVLAEQLTIWITRDIR